MCLHFILSLFISAVEISSYFSSKTGQEYQLPTASQVLEELKNARLYINTDIAECSEASNCGLWAENLIEHLY